MRLTTLIFLLLFCFQGLFAQSRTQSITPFEDYKQCLTGFVNQSGDTVYHPKFEEVYEVSIYRDYDSIHWLARLDGFLGILDNKGKEVIPFEYNQLIESEEGFILAEKEGEFGVISLDNETLLDFKYELLSFISGSDQIRTRKNGKYGIINYQFETIVPEEYNWVESHELINNDFKKSLEYFIVYSDRGIGLLDSLGEQLTDVTYSSIDPHFRVLHDSLSRVYYTVKNQNGKVGMINSSGEVVVPINYSILNYNESNSREGKHPLEYAVVMDSLGKTIYQLNSQIKSARYNYLSGNNARWIAYKDEFGYVLDSNLVEMIKLPEKNLTWGNYSSYSYHHDYPVRPINWYDDVVIMDSNSKGGERYLAFIHLKSKRATPHLYAKMLVKRIKDEMFYWGVKSEKEGVTEFDVYDVNMNLINTVKFLESRSLHLMENYDHGWKDSGLYVLKDENGKVGAIDISGEPKVPFEYEDYEPLYHYGGYERITPTPDLMVFKNEDYNSILHPNGDKLLDSLESAWPFFDSSLVIFKNGSHIWYDNDFKVLGSDLKKIFKTNEIAENQKEYIYADRNDTLYYWKNNKWCTTDSNHVEFYRPLKLVNLTYLINKYGKIVSGFGAQEIETTNYYLVLYDEKLQVMDKTGRLIKTIENCNYCSNQNGEIEVVTKSGSGILNKRNGTWDIVPRYRDIGPVFRKDGIVTEFWIEELDSVTHDGGYWYDDVYLWKLIRPDGSYVIDVGMDDPYQMIKGRYNIYRQDGYYGVLDEDFNKYIEPKYSNILIQDGVIFLKDWYRWSIFKGDSIQKFNRWFSAIQLDSFSNGKRLVFKKNKVGIIDSNLEFILPYTRKKKIENKMNLADELGLSKKSDSLFLENRIVIGSDSEAYHRINNRIILTTAYRNSTQCDFLRSARIFEIRRSKLAFINTDYSDEYSCRPVFYSEKYYSEEIENFVSWEKAYHEYPTTTFNNYKIVKGDLKPLNIDELFDPEKDFNDTITAIVIEFMNEKQPYGLSCVNIEEIVNELKTNFELHPKGILFRFSDKEYLEMFVEYGRLRNILKDPQHFL